MRSVALQGMLVGLALILATSPAAAQRGRRARRAVAGAPSPVPTIGPLIGYDFDADHLFLGGVATIPVAPRLALAPSIELYPGVTGTPYRLNIDVNFHPPTTFGLFYFGGGLAILHSSGNNDTGLNVFGGWEGRRAYPMRPFAEAKLVFASSTSFNILGGLRFPI